MKVNIELTPCGVSLAVKCEQVTIIRGELALILNPSQSGKYGSRLQELGLELFKPNEIEHAYFLRQGGGKSLEGLGSIRIG